LVRALTFLFLPDLQLTFSSSRSRHFAPAIGFFFPFLPGKVGSLTGVLFPSGVLVSPLTAQAVSDKRASSFLDWHFFSGVDEFFESLFAVSFNTVGPPVAFRRRQVCNSPRPPVSVRATMECIWHWLYTPHFKTPSGFFSLFLPWTGGVFQCTSLDRNRPVPFPWGRAFPNHSVFGVP